MKASLWSIKERRKETKHCMSEDGGDWVEMRACGVVAKLGTSSKTPTAFPGDIHCVSNSIQTLWILPLCSLVCQYLCAHTSMVWLSSWNWGQIALRCRYFGMRWFFFTACSLRLHLPTSPLFRPISFFPDSSLPHILLPRAPLFIPSRTPFASIPFRIDSSLQAECGAGKWLSVFQCKE